MALTFSASALLPYYSTIVGWLLLTYQHSSVTWAVLMCAGTVGMPLCVFLISMMRARTEAVMSTASRSI
jgi:hypothetical protein